MVWTITTLFGLALYIIRSPVKSFTKKKRRMPPQALLDPSLGRHEYVTANGIRFHYVTAGDKLNPLMLLLHGYPEFWYSWRHQIREFSKYYHVVAIDMRGYGETDKPAGVNNYKLSILTEDVAQLIQALSTDGTCTLVGHDWGGAIAWSVAANYPQYVSKLIVMNCPHPRIFYEEMDWNQLKLSWYMLLYQTRWLPEFMFSMNDYAILGSVYRGKKSGLKNRDNFSKEDLEAYKYTFSQDGALTPPINYIRCVFVDQLPVKDIQVSTLLIWGDDDAFLGRPLIEPNKRVCTDITIKRIPNCSHWVQQDCPQLVNQYIREFLGITDDY